MKSHWYDCVSIKARCVARLSWFPGVRREKWWLLQNSAGCQRECALRDELWALRVLRFKSHIKDTVSAWQTASDRKTIWCKEIFKVNLNLKVTSFFSRNYNWKWSCVKFFNRTKVGRDMFGFLSWTWRRKNRIMNHQSVSGSDGISAIRWVLAAFVCLPQ